MYTIVGKCTCEWRQTPSGVGLVFWRLIYFVQCGTWISGRLAWDSFVWVGLVFQRMRMEWTDVSWTLMSQNWNNDWVVVHDLSMDCFFRHYKKNTPFFYRACCDWQKVMDTSYIFNAASPCWILHVGIRCFVSFKSCLSVCLSMCVCLHVNYLMQRLKEKYATSQLVAVMVIGSYLEKYEQLVVSCWASFVFE